MNDLIRSDQRLPAIPVPWIHPLEGRNIVACDLVPALVGRNITAETAIAEFRTNNSAQNQPYYRRYFLRLQKSTTRGGQPSYSLFYVWNTKKPKTDELVGVVIGDDIEMALVLIGNHAARRWMTSINWILCEDRDGKEPIEMGRFDPWSFLTKVTAHDLERLERKDVVPNLEGWDFDDLWFQCSCPRCGEDTSVLAIAFDTDSAVCAGCGARPWLSGALHRLLAFAAPVSATDQTPIRDPKEVFLHAVRWMGGVNASPNEVEPPVQKQMLELAAHSRLLILGETGRHELTPVVRTAITQMAGPASAAISDAAIGQLVDTLISGDRLNPIQAALANLIDVASRTAGGPRLLHG